MIWDPYQKDCNQGRAHVLKDVFPLQKWAS
jgi:hypothetical protein